MENVEATIVAFGKLGVKVMITELDVDTVQATQRQTSADVSEVARSTGSSTNALSDATQLQLANRYADLFRVFFKHRDVVDRVTLWRY